MAAPFPVYSASAAFVGISNGRTRHMALVAIQPSGGDYAQTPANGGGEQDVGAADAAIAYAQVVIAATPSGQLVPPGAVFAGIVNGYQQISAATLQAATAPTVPAGTKYIIAEPEAGNVRWRDDAVDPTALIGQPVYVGQQLVYAAVKADGSLGGIKFIDQDANGILNLTYYK